MISPIGGSPVGPVGPSSNDSPKDQVNARLTQLRKDSDNLLHNPYDASMKTLVQGDMAFIKRTMNEAPPYTFTEVQFSQMNSLDQNVGTFANKPTTEGFGSVADVVQEMKNSLKE